ncbi:malate dehydrogenase [Candidatus Omnitrophota bacterium]
MKVSIIGAGNVGGLTASGLCAFGVSEIVLVDALGNLARAKALDLNDAAFLYKQSYRVAGTDDISSIAGSDILVITAGIPRRPGMKREELVLKNSQIIKGISVKIKSLCPEAVVIVVTNPLDAMTYQVIKETGFLARRVLGMGLTLDCSRLANLLAEKLGVAVTEIEPYIIGAHGEGMLPLARYTKIKGKPLDKYLKPEEINKIFQRTVGRGAEIVSFLGSGSAYFAPSAAIAGLVRAIAKNTKEVLPVSAYLNGECGLKDLCIGLPCSLGRSGIEKIIEPELNDREKQDFLESAESIKKQLIKYNV